MWRREGGGARQAQPAPPLALAAGLARIAVEAEDLAGLWDAAGDLAGTLEGTAAEELAAAMVHPPADDAFLRTFPDGLFRHQVAGACAIAHLPWSAAQPILESLVFGPVDWTAAAAIVALGELARRDAERARGIRAFLLTVRTDLLPHSSEPRFWPLVSVLASLPGVPREAHDALRAWHRKYVDEGEDSSPEPPLPAEPEKPAELAEPVLASLTAQPQARPSFAAWIAVGVAALLLLLAWLAW